MFDPEVIKNMTEEQLLEYLVEGPEPTPKNKITDLAQWILVGLPIRRTSWEVNKISIQREVTKHKVKWKVHLIVPKDIRDIDSYKLKSHYEYDYALTEADKTATDWVKVTAKH